LGKNRGEGGVGLEKGNDSNAPGSAKKESTGKKMTSKKRSEPLGSREKRRKNWQPAFGTRRRTSSTASGRYLAIQESQYMVEFSGGGGKVKSTLSRGKPEGTNRGASEGEPGGGGVPGRGNKGPVVTCLVRKKKANTSGQHLLK